MKKKFEFACKVQVESDVTVFAMNDSKAEALAQSKFEDEVDEACVGTNINRYDDAECECSDSDGTDWYWSAQEQYDMDREHFGGHELMWHKQEVAYYLGEDGEYLLLFYDDVDNGLTVAAVRGKQVDVTRELLDKVFSGDETYSDYIAYHSYEDIDWDDDDSERSPYTFDVGVDERNPDDCTMGAWLEELKENELRPFTDLLEPDTEKMQEKLYMLYGERFKEIPAGRCMQQLVDDAIQWGFDNHGAEDLSIEDSASLFLEEFVEYNERWHQVNGLREGDIIMFFCRLGDDNNGWHMGVFDHADIQQADIHSDTTAQEVFVREAQDIYSKEQNGVDIYHTYALDDIIRIKVLSHAGDAERIKELEYTISNIKAVLCK